MQQACQEIFPCESSRIWKREKIGERQKADHEALDPPGIRAYLPRGRDTFTRKRRKPEDAVKSTHIPPSPPCPDHLPIAADKPWLAPLAGYSDLSFRLLCREYGAACCCTEMVSAKGLIYESRGTGMLLASLPEDQPLVVQLFGGEEKFLRLAVRELVRAGYRWFDLNMGCSVRKVFRQGAGAGMLGDRENCLACARAMLEEAGPGHVGFKLRLGLDAARPVLPDLALRLADLGAGWISLHPRTAKQGFGGRADWSEIAALAGRLPVPIIASGDLFTAEDGMRCLAETGAAAVMYARGALRRPTVFADHAALCRGGSPAEPCPPALRRMLLRHLALAGKVYPGRDQTPRMRGILCSYVRGLPGSRAMREALCRCGQWDGLFAIIDEYLPPQENDPA